LNALTKRQTVVLASGNQGKLRELQRVLAPLDVELRCQGDFDVPEVEETGLTFVENALIKARAAAAHTGLPSIADDSGLEVDYLQGRPGIHSARYSGRGDAGNNERLLQELGNLPGPQRSARYQCVLVYLRHATDPVPLICHAHWEGLILTEPRGTGGFGYDPLFFLTEQQCSAAELDPEVKNRISHRAQASAKLLDALRRRG
jgi:XTP/dITP diphosphohydrolase